MLMQRSSKYNAWATEGGGVGHAAVGETHEIAYVNLLPIMAQHKGKMRSAKMFKQLQLP
jgi:hypothetical protein